MLSLSKTLTPIDLGSTCPWGNAPHSPELTISVGAKALMGIGETFQTEDTEKKNCSDEERKQAKCQTMTLGTRNGTLPILNERTKRV